MSFNKKILFFLILPFFQYAEVKANLIDQYNKQESTQYDEYNECLKIWNKADYYDYYQYGKPFANFQGPKFYIRQLPTGEEILFSVNPNYRRNFAPNKNIVDGKEVKFWQRCHEPIRIVPRLNEIVIGEVYPTFNVVGEEDGGARAARHLSSQPQRPPRKRAWHWAR